MDEISKFLQDQLSVWPLASSNFRGLKQAQVKELDVAGIHCKIQHNPCRIASSTAEVDAASLAARPCFLCVPNRPAQQFHIKFEGRKDRHYNIQVNPYPIFPSHFVIARDIHSPQSIWHNFVDMMDFARKYQNYLVFYNGPFSGASAPDHMHFQAIPKDLLPLQKAIDEFLDQAGEPLTTGQDAKLYHFPKFCRGIYAFRSDTPKSLAKLFYRLVDCAPLYTGEPEPRLNLYIYCYKNEYRCFVVLRGQVRSHHYYSTGDDHLTMTPGAADMAGFFVCPKLNDFQKLNSKLLEEILEEVSISPKDEEMIAWRLTRTQTRYNIPILSGEKINFEMISDGAGPQSVSYSDGRIEYGGVLYDELFFDSVTRSKVFGEPSFVIESEGERLLFAGSLIFNVVNGTIRAINRIGIENYMLSVLSQKYPDVSDVEFLKQEAISLRSSISRGEVPLKAYKGLSTKISTYVRQAIDSTWGLLN